jgi:hypothetical protein
MGQRSISKYNNSTPWRARQYVQRKHADQEVDYDIEPNVTCLIVLFRFVLVFSYK